MTGRRQSSHDDVTALENDVMRDLCCAEVLVHNNTTTTVSALLPHLSDSTSTEFRFISRKFSKEKDLNFPDFVLMKNFLKRVSILLCEGKHVEQPDDKLLLLET